MKPNILRDGDTIAGGLTAALGVYITMTAMRWEVMGPDGPGPGFFPVGYGVALVALSIILIVQRAAAKRTNDETAIDWQGLRRAATTWIAFAGAAALMPIIGFFVSLGLLTLFLSLTVFEKSLKTALLNGVLIGLGFYIVFGLALDVSLPTGLLGF
ncbi:MAG: tripartite tricarboxylate transporter TctB family protein [Beijerinckiaceae bacterium]|nr:tripartite tricarboxylate transporter TctB family protein [Beijerinckiaceae bacterium]